MCEIGKPLEIIDVEPLSLPLLLPGQGDSRWAGIQTTVGGGIRLCAGRKRTEEPIGGWHNDKRDIAQ
jgi:hypothetical protein